MRLLKRDLETSSDEEDERDEAQRLCWLKRDLEPSSDEEDERDEARRVSWLKRDLESEPGEEGPPMGHFDRSSHTCGKFP